MKRDLSEGSIGKSLLLFSFPMIVGNLLQQLYNVVDTLIVGQTIGAHALSAVGSAYAFMVLLTSIILGLCMGSGVVFSQLYGAKKEHAFKVCVVNAFVLILVVSVVLCIGAYFLLDELIMWLQIPKEAILASKEYLSIIFIGIVFVFLYNYVSAILRSVGNTLIPLFCLGISAIMNIILDVIFIVDFDMGVGGAAWATVISQIVSAILITIYFLWKERSFCPSCQHIYYDGMLLRLVMTHSTLTAIQQSIMNFGILLIQGRVNHFGFLTSAAFAAVVKIDAFAYMPAQDFGNAFATFIAQNHGAGKTERIEQGTRFALLVSSLFCVISSMLVCIFAYDLMCLFVKAEETKMISIGMTYLHIEGASYIGIGILFLLYGLYRGLGNSMMSIVLTIVSLGSRVLLAYSLSAIDAIGIIGIWWSVPIGWALADILGISYFVKNKDRLLKNSIV